MYFKYYIKTFFQTHELCACTNFERKMNSKTDELPNQKLSLNENYPYNSSFTPPTIITDDIHINIELEEYPASASENTSNFYSSSLNCYVSTIDSNSPAIMVFADCSPSNSTSNNVQKTTDYEMSHVKPSEVIQTEYRPQQQPCTLNSETDDDDNESYDDDDKNIVSAADMNNVSLLAPDPELSDTESDLESDISTDSDSDTNSDEHQSEEKKSQSSVPTYTSIVSSVSSLIISQLPSIVTQSIFNQTQNTIEINDNFMDETNLMYEQLTDILSTITHEQSTNHNTNNNTEHKMKELEINSVMSEVLVSTATISSYFAGPVQNRISNILSIISSSVICSSSSSIYHRMSWMSSKITPYAYKAIEQLLLELYSILNDIIEYYDPNPKRNILLCIIDKLTDIIRAIQGLIVLSDCFLGNEEKK